MDSKLSSSLYVHVMHTLLQVYYRPESSSVESFVVVQDYTPGSIYILGGLSPNTVYNISVTASTNGGKGADVTVTGTTTFGGWD